MRLRSVRCERRCANARSTRTNFSLRTHGSSCAHEHRWTAIVGPNCAGKSTLLRALARLLKPASGQVTLHGNPLMAYAPSERGKAIMWLAQQGETTGDRTARETVHLGRLPPIGLFGAPTAKDDAIADAALAATETTAWQHRRLHELSGGERQRVLISRALGTEFPVLLVIRDGAVTGHGESNDAALHTALTDAFDQAIAVIPAIAPGKRTTVCVRLDDCSEWRELAPIGPTRVSDYVD